MHCWQVWMFLLGWQLLLMKTARQEIMRLENSIETSLHWLVNWLRLAKKWLVTWLDLIKNILWLDLNWIKNGLGCNISSVGNFTQHQSCNHRIFWQDNFSCWCHRKQSLLLFTMQSYKSYKIYNVYTILGDHIFQMSLGTKSFIDAEW